MSIYHSTNGDLMNDMSRMNRMNQREIQLHHKPVSRQPTATEIL
jgi:hypothetical protein